MQDVAIGILFTGVSIVRERERGNMGLLIATPISSAELMVGKVAPYVVIGLLQTSVVLMLGVGLFDVPISGAIAQVYVAAMLPILANLTHGLLISTRARSQFQAMQMTFFLFLPSILLSGFMFPFADMPRPLQWFAELLPLTHFVRDPRHHAARRRSARHMGRRTCPRRLHNRDDDAGNGAVSQAAGLSES